MQSEDEADPWNRLQENECGKALWAVKAEIACMEPKNTNLK